MPPPRPNYLRYEHHREKAAVSLPKTAVPLQPINQCSRPPFFRTNNRYVSINFLSRFLRAGGRVLLAKLKIVVRAIHHILPGIDRQQLRFQVSHSRPNLHSPLLLRFRVSHRMGFVRVLKNTLFFTVIRPECRTAKQVATCENYATAAAAFSKYRTANQAPTYAAIMLLMLLYMDQALQGTLDLSRRLHALKQSIYATIDESGRR